MFRRKKESVEAQKAKDAREKKKLALFLTPNPPTPPLKKRSGRQPLKQGNAVIPRGMEDEYPNETESSSESSSASTDSSTSGSSSEKSEEALARSPSPDSSPEAKEQVQSPFTPRIKPQESREVVYVLSNPGLQASASSNVPKKSNLKKTTKTKKKRQPCLVHDVPRRSSHHRSHKKRADKSPTESNEECNLLT
ncbi:uncharacterized protein LOC144094640 isoform X2 [Amblyomma americanum]